MQCIQFIHTWTTANTNVLDRPTESFEECTGNTASAPRKKQTDAETHLPLVLSKFDWAVDALGAHRATGAPLLAPGREYVCVCVRACVSGCACLDVCVCVSVKVLLVFYKLNE